jgi:hypothetical protein
MDFIETSTSAREVEAGADTLIPSTSAAGWNSPTRARTREGHGRFLYNVSDPLSNRGVAVECVRLPGR